jgi:hypothetical protein
VLGDPLDDRWRVRAEQNTLPTVHTQEVTRSKRTARQLPH